MVLVQIMEDLYTQKVFIKIFIFIPLKVPVGLESITFGFKTYHHFTTKPDSSMLSAYICSSSFVKKMFLLLFNLCETIYLVPQIQKPNVYS